MLTAAAIGQQVRDFILTNFLYGIERALRDCDSLASEGILDSTGVLELVSFLEEAYGISVEEEEMTPDNLDSISKIAAYVAKKLDGIPGDNAVIVERQV